MQRLFIIVASIVVVLGIAAVLYFVFFGSAAPHLTVGSPSAFNSSASGTVPSSNNSTTPVQISGSAGTVVAPNLIKITASPVAAGTAVIDIAPTFSTATSTATASSTDTTVSNSSYSNPDIEVRYIDRESGNIYAYRSQARSLTRISNKTLPGIQEASWLPSGGLAFVRFITQTSGTEQLSTYALPDDGSDGYFLPSDLAQVFVTGSSTFFTLSTGTDGSIGSVAQYDGTHVQTVFTSPLADILVRAAGAGFIAVTKAASESDGYAFSVNGSSTFIPIIGPLRGLTALPSPSGKLVLYSYTNGSRFYMNVQNLSTGSVTALPLATLTDKCVWTSDSAYVYCAIPNSFVGNLPDDWYQGVASFTDQIWRFDLNNRLATLVVDPSQAGRTDIDAVNLTLDSKTQLLVFRNKKDSSLWAYSL